MKKSSQTIKLVALAQIVPLALFPWTWSLSSLIAIAIIAALCAVLGWALLQRKWWGRTLTIFVQGLNVIIRVITLFHNVYSTDGGLNVPLLATYVLSVVISVVILGHVDKPQVQLVFES